MGPLENSSCCCCCQHGLRGIYLRGERSLQLRQTDCSRDACTCTSMHNTGQGNLQAPLENGASVIACFFSHSEFAESNTFVQKVLRVSSCNISLHVKAQGTIMFFVVRAVVWLRKK